MIRKAIYPGRFDPFTLGHQDLVARASGMFDEVEVLVSINPNKSYKLKEDARVKLAEEAVKKFKNVKVSKYEGLTVDYAKNNGFKAILRGLRAASDFEMELEMSQINNKLSGIDTMFLMTSPELSFIRASRVWELINLNVDINHIVPKNVANYLEQEF